MTRLARLAPLLSVCGCLVLACARPAQPEAPTVVVVDSPSPPPAPSAGVAAPRAAPSITPPATPAARVVPAEADIATTGAGAPATPPAAPPLDVATCKARAAPSAAACKWMVADVGRCGGARLVHEPPPTPTCVCNGCDVDSDCTAKPRGKCETFFKVCSPSAKACVYPGDPCFDQGRRCSNMRYTRPGNRVSEPKACSHDGNGHAVCGPRQSPPP